MTKEEFMVEHKKIADRWMWQLTALWEHQKKTGDYEGGSEMWSEACDQFAKANNLLVEQLSPEDVASIYPEGYPPPKENVSFLDYLLAQDKKEKGELN